MTHQVSGISFTKKILFGIGQSAESIKNFAFGTLLLLYYNQVLGLPGTYSGIAVAIALAFDAVTDPAMGSWSDGFRHRLGRRHLFMIYSLVPLGISYFLLFWPPDGLSDFGLFLWLTVFAILSRSALTLFHVPYLALGAEMSSNYQERSQIAAIRQGVGMLSSLLVVLLTWNYIMVATPAEPNPQLLREPYFEFAVVSAVIMLALMAVSIFGTLSLIPSLSVTQNDHPNFSLRRVYRDIFDALKNKQFFALFWGSLLFMVFMGVQSSLAMHTKTFFWELDVAGIKYVQYAGIVGGILGLFLLGPFHRLFDKRMTLIIGVVVYTGCATLPIALQLVGWMPSDLKALTWALIAAQLIGYAGIIHAGVSGVSMMGDIADQHELDHGRRQEGVYFGSHNFALKCTTALGNLIAGFALDFVNFPVNSVPGAVPGEVLFDYGIVNLALVFMAAVGIWVFLPYSLSRERHAQIQEQLAGRREADSELSIEKTSTASA